MRPISLYAKQGIFAGIGRLRIRAGLHPHRGTITNLADKGNLMAHAAKRDDLAIGKMHRLGQLR